MQVLIQSHPLLAIGAVLTVFTVSYLVHVFSE